MISKRSKNSSKKWRFTITNPTVKISTKIYSIFLVKAIVNWIWFKLIGILYINNPLEIAENIQYNKYLNQVHIIQKYKK